MAQRQLVDVNKLMSSSERQTLEQAISILRESLEPTQALSIHLKSVMVIRPSRGLLNNLEIKEHWKYV